MTDRTLSGREAQAYAPAPARPITPVRTWLRRVAGLVALAAVLWLGWCGLRVALSARSALQDVARLRGLAADPGPQALPALHDDVASLEFHLKAAQAAGRPFWWLLPRLAWLPRIGPDLAAVPPLLNMGVALAGSGHQALNALAPVAAVLADGQGDLLARAVPALAAAAPQLAPIDAGLAQAEAYRAQVAGPLSPRLAALVARIDQMLPLARPGLRGLQVAPALLGADGPRTYLLLAQNNHELRATGGFISGVGVVRLDRGRIVDLRMADSYAVDNFAQPHPDAPRVLAEQMGAQMLLLRDSNWSPDFRASAQVARTLYEQDQGVATDGAIAVDLEAVRLLAGALGPLTVPGRPAPITGANVIDQMKQAWSAPDGDTSGARSAEWWRKRKDFMGPFMTAALARLQGGQDLHVTALAAAVLQMLDERHLQIAVDDGPAAALLAGQGWDGALRLPEQGDFLAVVDSNLGFNKVNAAVRQEIGYRVEPEAGASGLIATLTLTYTHTARPIAGECDRTPRYRDSYDEMIDRCYWDYLRVYLPAGSSLLVSSGLAEASSLVEAGEGGSAMIAGNLVLRPGAAQQVTLRYRLLAAAGGEPYRLTVRAQAGAMAPRLAVQAGACRWQSDLSRDRTFVCSRGNP